MAAIRFKQVQRFILAKRIFEGQGHFKDNTESRFILKIHEKMTEANASVSLIMATVL